MNNRCPALLLALVFAFGLSQAQGYSASEDARIIEEYKREIVLNHAKKARELVHSANWAAVGSISTNKIVENYPMVNIISIDDSDMNGKSTGKIRFLLTDLDFTGPDWRKNNKVTLMFSGEQTLNCTKHSTDPMEPTCARSMISGQVREFDTTESSYQPALDAFIKRHPAANKWMKAHSFYLCELIIRNIFVLDFYGGPHQVTASDYYAVRL